MSCGEHPADCIVSHICPAVDGRATGPRQWSATCPSCGERKLSVGLGDKTRVVIKCHRGCEFDAIRDALPAAIRPCLGRGRAGRHRKTGQSPETKRLIDFIANTSLPAAALRLGLLIELGIPAEDARKLLDLTKTTYYRAMNQIPTRR